MPFKIGVTTGLYYIAHDVSLASTVKKIGYALTRGANVVEISGDTPHEISYTEGTELRNISKNQGLDLFFHGSLTVPMCMPERTDWRDAQDHMEKSVRSAVNAGCKYVLFHACLHFWVELLTYTGTKLTITMCDHAGRFISEILHENEKLRNWFVKNMRNLGEIQYPGMILSDEEFQDAAYRAHAETLAWQQGEIEDRKRRMDEEIGYTKALEEYRRRSSPQNLDKVQRLEAIYRERSEKIQNDVGAKTGKKRAVLEKNYINKVVEEKMAKKDPEVRRWKVETYGRLVDAYKIMAHYLFFTKDPQWVSMAAMYKNVLDRYKVNYSGENWLMDTWNKAEVNNDTEFKQFFYAVIGAKFLEGHIRALIKWIDNEYIPKELKGSPELQEIARNLKITIEIPDSRDPKYAGRYMLCHPKQIYSAIKTLKRELNTNRVWMTMDFEHMATQGFDPNVEMKKMIKISPDFGKDVISVHCAKPTPLHSHYPIELGDTDFYELLWYLRLAGTGKDPKHLVYLVFERGGGDDPFRQAVDALRLMAEYLEKDTPPDKLDTRFYGLNMTAFDEKRQKEIMMDHRFDVLKDLFEVPEEEWGLLSTAAVKKGKKEIFKKEELR